MTIERITPELSPQAELPTDAVAIDALQALAARAKPVAGAVLAWVQMVESAPEIERVLGALQREYATLTQQLIELRASLETERQASAEAVATAQVAAASARQAATDERARIAGELEDARAAARRARHELTTKTTEAHLAHEATMRQLAADRALAEQDAATAGQEARETAKREHDDVVVGLRAAHEGLVAELTDELTALRAEIRTATEKRDGIAAELEALKARLG